MDETSTNTNPHFLSGGGEMGERIRSLDWSKTPLGSPHEWSPSLQSTVSIMLANRFPLLLWWGSEYISLYNDAYAPILGTKHPSALSLPVSECWSEIWHILQPLIDTPFHGGSSTWIEDFQLLLNRSGFLEESHFTVAYSPVPDRTAPGGIGGVLASVHEITDKVVNERALATLRELGTVTFEEKSLDIIYRNVAEALGKNNKDFPFILVYKITGDENNLTVAASMGIDKNQNVLPDVIDISNPTAITQDFCLAFREDKMVISEIKAEDKSLPKGAWEIAPTQFVHIPVSVAGASHPYCIISAAINPFRKFNDAFKEFCRLIGDRVSIDLSKMLALKEETKRAEALSEIDKAKTVFFSNISHEFRTPLTLMLSPLEELLNQKNNNFSESEKDNIETAHRNALRLLKLVNRLLDFSRIESGRQQGVFSLMDIAALTKNLASNFRSVIEKAGLKLIVKADSIIKPVYVDKQMWEKIVFNLLSNAFKYTLEGSIIVELTSEKDFAVLKIKDTGVGIPENELPKMFERFHRVQNVTGRTHEGTGIGLSMIKELVQMHHGTIGVESRLNKGSVFTVKIPFGKEHLNGHSISNIEINIDEIYANIYIDEAETLLNTEKITKESSTAKHSNLQLPTVLVVDDNADMREHISSILSNNFNVITANNGMDALHRMKETIPALVLSDIMMPVMDGIGLLKEIKSNKSTENIPVIFLTARAGEESRIEGWETGADDYLVKPFSAKELLSRIKAQIKTVKLRQSLEGNLRNLLMEAPAAICVLRGPQHVHELTNERYLQLVGKRNIIGLPVSEAFPEFKGQGLYELLDNVYATGVPFVGNEMPTKLDKGNGNLEEIYINFVYQPYHNSEGEVDGILVHGVDVTEQVLARKKIEESEKQFSTLANNIQNLAWIADGEGWIFWYNQRWYDYTGTTFDEMEGWGWEKVHHPDHIERVIDFVKQAWQKNEPFEITFPLRRKDGKYCWFLTRVFPVKDAKGKVLRWIGTNTDIEEQKVFSEQLEEKVNERTVQLNTANQNLEEKNTELQKMNKELEAFTYISSHDLQEPLRKIQTFAGRIIATEEEHLSDTAKEYFSRMQYAATRMQTLIEDLLAFSRLSTSERKFEKTDLSKIVDEVKEEFKETMEEKNATIIADEMCEANIIPFQFCQLMHNLIGNALKFSKKDVPPHIIIKSELLKGSHSPFVNRDACHISVSDNGIGFEKQFSERIFGVFQRLHGKSEYTGTGIGLAIVKKIVENHDGIITAQSEVEKGATFNIYLPV